MDGYSDVEIIAVALKESVRFIKTWVQLLMTVIAISDPQWDLQISNISIWGNLRLDLSFLLILIAAMEMTQYRIKKAQ